MARALNTQSHAEPPSLAENLGIVATDLLRALDDENVRCWIDSGSLLGLVRDGRLPPWDKDIDLGVWRQDLGCVAQSARALASHYGLSFEEKRLKGRTYALTLRPGPQTPNKTLPIAIHVFDRHGEYAVSPQPHFLLVKGARYARLVLQQRRSMNARCCGHCSNFSDALKYRLIVLVSSLRLRRVVKWALDFGQRRSADGVAQVHPSERLFFRMFFEVFQWTIPSNYFDDLKAEPLVEGRMAYLPADSAQYLALRYGAGWREPRQDWFYVTDDGAIAKQVRGSGS